MSHPENRTILSSIRNLKKLSKQNDSKIFPIKRASTYYIYIPHIYYNTALHRRGEGVKAFC